MSEWGKDKPIGLRMVAQQLAVGAEPVFKFLKLIKAGERIELFSGKGSGVRLTY